MLSNQIENRCKQILEKTDAFAGKSIIIDEFHHLKDGGNNSIYNFDAGLTANALESYIVKCYPTPDKSDHNRMNAEWSFLQHSHALLPELVPQPVAQSPSANISIFSRLDGQPIDSSRVTSNMVEQYLNFIAKINNKIDRSKPSEYGVNIPVASDSSINSMRFLDDILLKIESLSKSSVKSEEFVKVIHRMRNAYTVLRADIEKAFSQREGFQWILPEDAQILSPSDVGFHNCLRANDGDLQFLDFEYAGWDDVSKLFADFFLTPQAPLPLAYVSMVKSKLLKIIPEKYRDDVEIRMDVLFPAFALKWCCIRLNPFLDDWVKARNFYTDDDHKLAELRAARIKATSEEIEKITTRTISKLYIRNSKEN